METRLSRPNNPPLGNLPKTEDEAREKIKKQIAVKDERNALSSDRASRVNEMGDTYKKGGSVSASSRADGCAVKGKTKGRIV
jgi:hypothetical protein